ncbi:MAG: hypothetical protein Q4F63_03245 [Clostridia bacterium]|nr:hypothetical protein [Clostridia bacterium]
MHRKIYLTAVGWLSALAESADKHFFQGCRLFDSQDHINPNIKAKGKTHTAVRKLTVIRASKGITKNIIKYPMPVYLSVKSFIFESTLYLIP